MLAGSDDKQLYEYIVKDPAGGPLCNKCTICGKTGNDRSNLRKHVENAHFNGVFSYECKYCPSIFGTRTKLNHHVTSAHRGFNSFWNIYLFRYKRLFYACSFFRGQAALRLYREGAWVWPARTQMYSLWKDWQWSRKFEETRWECSFPWNLFIPMQTLPSWLCCVPNKDEAQQSYVNNAQEYFILVSPLAEKDSIFLQ